MKTKEAYELTLRKVQKLKDSGIKCTINPYSGESIKELSIRYNEVSRIKSDKWISVNFSNLDKGQSLKVHEVANYLGMCGITFDIGGTADTRAWELDWSFEYTGKEDEERRDARDEVENIWNNMDDRAKS